MEQVIAFDAAPSPNGDGSGSGDGYGYGSGSGDGYGYGSGYGYGDGSGSGDGYGSGYGSGYGYGDGDEVNAATYHAALAGARTRKDAVMALWGSNRDGTPANGGRLAPVKVGDVHETKGPLMLCKSGTLHATWHPERWRGERWWIVALYGEVAVGPDKLGALKREIVAEIV